MNGGENVIHSSDVDVWKRKLETWIEQAKDIHERVKEVNALVKNEIEQAKEQLSLSTTLHTKVFKLVSLINLSEETHTTHPLPYKPPKYSLHNSRDGDNSNNGSSQSNSNENSGSGSKSVHLERLLEESAIKNKVFKWEEIKGYVCDMMCDKWGSVAVRNFLSEASPENRILFCFFPPLTYYPPSPNLTPKKSQKGWRLKKHTPTQTNYLRFFSLYQSQDPHTFTNQHHKQNANMQITQNKGKTPFTFTPHLNLTQPLTLTFTTF
eukprot:TRINITY_DN2197_c0_g1_i2.p2 TRINITY_DN2197_c0_g1~~TRINITY_DN2197_c0_g1_i2.p2  ORF type:complete len:309 (-),score=81.02 TRINITY_DN2197_c0_g1_i2:779-1573(-)